MALKSRYPTGVRPLLVEEAARRRRIEARFIATLEDAGFSEVVLPMIDYVDPYVSFLGQDAARQTYRFVDREGELVAIRSDFTPMLARALAPAITKDNLPLRVFYRGDVIRCDASRLGANREMFQIGAEIVGDESIEADLAVLRLSAALIRQFDLEPTVVYTDAAITEALIGGSPAVRTALATKRMHADVPRALCTVTEKLIAGAATLDDVRPFAPAAISRLESISLALADDRFVLHLDDLDDGAGYYSGLRFRVYAGASRTKLAQGGRYDRLYERFGMSAAAVGFTFTIDDLD